MHGYLEAIPVADGRSQRPRDLDVSITGDTMARMDTVTIRDLRNHGGDVVGRVEAGQRITVTRDGRPVAELRPLRSRGVSAAALLERWRRLPAVDPEALRRDVDTLVDQAL
jgi:prevent-host-death family protein